MAPVAGGRWEVSLDDGTQRPTTRLGQRPPLEPEVPGASLPRPGQLEGEQLHSHWYREPDERFQQTNVLVLGIGNSATDIAVETSRYSAMTYLAMRRGAYVIPKYLQGGPTDELASGAMSRLPFWATRAMLSVVLRQAQGKMENYGLPTPDHKLGEAHPTISSDLLPRIGHGRIQVKPNIQRIICEFFVDGTSADIDTIVWCTGYKITFPFLAPT